MQWTLKYLRHFSLVGVLFVLAAFLDPTPTMASPNASGGEEPLKVYPNPATTVINVKITEQAEALLILTLKSIDGRVIIQDKVHAPGLHKVNTQLLPSGSYVLRIQNEDGTLDERTSFNKVNP